MEGEAGRGAQEVGSCLRKHIHKQIGPVKEFFFDLIRVVAKTATFK